MILVRLLKNVDYYETGTLCGWPDEKANELVARGLAEIVHPVGAQPMDIDAVVGAAVSRAMPSPVAVPAKGKANKG